jgi:UTP--glucose-1-phosphate uridylyltransferase
MTIRKAILPAAGLGTRFLPATKASPKEMLPIVDIPMIEYCVEEAKSCGIKEFIVITGKNKRAIEDHFDTAYELEESLKQSGKKELLNEIIKHGDLDFAYIRQGKPLGLGHAIMRAAPFVRGEPFVVMLGDDIIDPDDHLLAEMIEAFEKHRSPIIALYEVPPEDVSKYGIIDGVKEKSGLFKLKSLVEKPRREDAPSRYAVIGRYILTPEVFDVLKNMPPGAGGEYQLTDALNAMLRRKKAYGLLFKGKRYDAGDKLGFLQATIDLALKRPEFSDSLKEFIKARAGSF